mgnify:CR=1 FL=1
MVTARSQLDCGRAWRLIDLSDRIDSTTMAHQPVDAARWHILVYAGGLPVAGTVWMLELKRLSFFMVVLLLDVVLRNVVLGGVFVLVLLLLDC